MRFQNAYSGVKKIFTAEILQIFGVVVLGVATVLAAILKSKTTIDASAATITEGVGMLFGILAGVIILIVAFILKLVGLIKAGRDDKSFKNAFYMIIVGLVAVAVGAFFQYYDNIIMYNFCDTVNKVVDLFATIFIIQGIMSLADKLGDTEMVLKGAFIFKVIIGIYVFAILGAFAYALFFPFFFLSVIGVVLSCVSMFLSVLSYILFISYLSKARNMLG